MAATQPELVAQHYTEAGLTAQALGYWQKAGQRAGDRSAYQEALRHVTTGLSLLQTLPETLARQSDGGHDGQTLRDGRHPQSDRGFDHHDGFSTGAQSRDRHHRRNTERNPD